MTVELTASAAAGVSALYDVVNAYRRLNDYIHEISDVSKDLQLLEVLVSTHQSYFLNECRHIFNDIVKNQQWETLQDSGVAPSESESVHSEYALRLTLGAHHGSYTCTLQGISKALDQFITFLVEVKSGPQSRPGQLILTSQSRIDSLAEGNRALSMLRRLSFGTEISNARNITEDEAVPSQINLPGVASKILYEAALLVSQNEFAQGSTYQYATLSFLQEICGGGTLTLLFAHNSSSSSGSREISFHLDQDSLEHWDVHCQAQHPKITLECHELGKTLRQDSCGSSYTSRFASPTDVKRRRTILSVGNTDRPIVGVHSSINNRTCGMCRELDAIQIESNETKHQQYLERYPANANFIGCEAGMTMKRGCNGYSTPPFGPRKWSTGSRCGSTQKLVALPSCNKQRKSLKKPAGYVIVTEINEVSPDNAISFLDLIQSSSLTAAEVSELDRLRLAYNVASTVLQFYSTPFLRDDWSLNEIGLICPQNKQSTNLGWCFESIVLILRNGVQCGGTSATHPIYSALFGYSNASAALEFDSYCRSSLRPFYYLGIALLEIAYLQPYSFLRNKTLSMRTAQKVLIWQNPLGERYQEIVERCLDGNLGVESCSSISEIKNAAYNRIVCVLRDIIHYISP